MKGHTYSKRRPFSGARAEIRKESHALSRAYNTASAHDLGWQPAMAIKAVARARIALIRARTPGGRSGLAPQ